MATFEVPIGMSIAMFKHWPFRLYGRCLNVLIFDRSNIGTFKHRRPIFEWALPNNKFDYTLPLEGFVCLKQDLSKTFITALSRLNYSRVTKPDLTGLIWEMQSPGTTVFHRFLSDPGHLSLLLCNLEIFCRSPLCLSVKKHTKSFSSMFMFFLLRPYTKWRYRDVTMHALHFLSRERRLTLRRHCLTCNQKRGEGKGKWIASFWRGLGKKKHKHTTPFLLYDLSTVLSIIATIWLPVRFRYSGDPNTQHSNYKTIPITYKY